MKRRNFLISTLIGTGSLSGIQNLYGKGETHSILSGKKTLIRIGICTDLHQDLIKDGEQRLQSFITEMMQTKPDFIIQMGDFCVPKEKNKNLMSIWNQFTGPKYHVIGNHDTDGGFTHDQVVDFWSAKGKYYSFDVNGYHFVVLNGNERPEEDTSKGYPRSMNPAQIKWMKQDLEATNLPVIVFCHQGIDNDQDGLKEGALIRLMFERINKKAGFNKIQFVFSGHHHEDYHNIYNGINYVQINSISYQFTHPVTGYDFAHTKEPLWAVLTIYANGVAEIKGRKSEYAGQQATQNDPEYNGYGTTPYISDRVIKI
jgi:calcineurin-like phosphoesterase family protein